MSSFKKHGKLLITYEDTLIFRRAVWMEHLSDDLLIESYYTANKLNLSPDFIALIEEEIDRRKLTHKIKLAKQSG